MDVEVTRGRVDNENNSQSRYSNNIEYIQGGGLYNESESIAIRNGQWNTDRNTGKRCVQEGNTGMLCRIRKQEQE